MYICAIERYIYVYIYVYICSYGGHLVMYIIHHSIIQPGRNGSLEIPPTWLLNSVHIVEYRFGEKEM